MTSAWGVSWGVAWGDSWGATAPPPPPHPISPGEGPAGGMGAPDPRYYKQYFEQQQKLDHARDERDRDRQTLREMVARAVRGEPEQAVARPQAPEFVAKVRDEAQLAGIQASLMDVRRLLAEIRAAGVQSVLREQERLRLADIADMEEVAMVVLLS